MDYLSVAGSQSVGAYRFIFIRGDSRLPGLLFSIVIACHDQEAYVREAVESALFQGHSEQGDYRCR